MEQLKFIGIIPARYASTRFPGKPLAKIEGVTMIERVYRRASMVLDNVAVATDDSRIFDTVTAFGGIAVMTSDTHRSGTDRICEAYDNLHSNADVVINIQGDEPFIDPSQISALKECFDDKDVLIATLARPFDKSLGIEALTNRNTPKVVTDNNGNAMYFSRSVIPFVRNYPIEEWPEHASFLTHIGMYGYRADTLHHITRLPQSALEIDESLEQLRWHQNGYKIRVAVNNCPTIGIDTPEDFEKACALARELGI